VFVRVGTFWVCPTHGQVPEPGSFTALRIFLSYGHDANEELVRRIEADLEQRGHDVWFDKTEIKAGDDWRRAITDGIINSQRVVSFLSKHSTRDPGVCRDEIAIAIGVKGGNIQTILVESEVEVQPPVNIGHIQWLDMHDWKERRAAGEASWREWYQAKLAEIIRVVESEESRRFAGEIETLNGHLRPIKSEARVYDLLRKGFFGRKWLFEAVENWRQPENRDPRLFWITGDPGVGKSAFAAQLTHTRPDAVIAAQFVEWDKPDHRDARRIVRSLAFQLATRLPDYRKLLLTLPEIEGEKLDRKDPAELFDYLLANPLRSIIGGGRDRQLIVIDALDEAGEAGRNPLVEILARHAPRLPDWLGFVVTSRPESAVQTPLQGLNPFVLDTRTGANRADLRDYLRQELAPQLHDRPDADRLLGQILEKSEGVFLYVERFCADVQQNHLSLAHPEQFPQGLGGIFCQWFERQFPDLGEFRQGVRPALRAILAAREPLPVEILQRLFHWQDEELRDFTRILGSLFPVTKEPNGEVIKTYHKSLADWLVDEAKAGAYFASTKEGHRQLANDGLAVLSQENEPPVSRAISGYYARSVLSHFCVLENWDKVVHCIAEPKVFQNLWPGSYGLEFPVICHPDLLRHLWPESHSLYFYEGGSISIPADALRPESLDAIPIRSMRSVRRSLGEALAVPYNDSLMLTWPETAKADGPDPTAIEPSSKIAWALAEAFAARARDMQLRAFGIASANNKATNVIRNCLRDTPAFIEYRDLVYGFVYLAELAPAFALSRCHFEQVSIHQGRPILCPRDNGFQDQAKRFLETFQPIRSYIRYLVNFACNEGWSGQLESEACGPDEAWQKLAMLAYAKEIGKPRNFFKMSDLNYAIAERVDIESPWGATQTKPAGVDAFLVADEQENGEKTYYMVQMDSDGAPIGYSEA
jgi:hypothetical protein